ncbi:MAG: 23S rRNA (uracil(1939)-C(5))-methyltransferase RlmD [Bacillota bacterium]
MSEQVPVRVGQAYDIEITGLGQSEGVGRVDGFTVFVPGALPGEQVRARVDLVKKNYARAGLLEVVRRSPDRVEPSCPHFPECGGCQLQHLDYQAQLRWKRQQVADAIQRIGKLTGVEVLPTLGMADPWRYRNKVPFPVGGRGGQLVAGLYRSGTHDIVDMEGCQIQSGLADQAFREAKRLSAEHGLIPYDEIKKTGFLRHILIREGRQAGELMCVLVTNGEERTRTSVVARELMEAVPAVVSVQQNINTRPTNVIMGPKTILLGGKATITDYLGGLAFEISPLSFFQINPGQAEVLYNQVLAFCRLTGGETVFDLYCGIGTISLYLARRAGQVIGIESVPQAVEDARRNAERNGIGNVKFHYGEAEKLLPRLARQGARADVIVLDPPRRGCEPEVLETMAEMRPERIVYVSCNPATLARDLAVLSERGYRPEVVQPVDMFPHTGHVECIIQIKRAESRMK